MKKYRNILLVLSALSVSGCNYLDIVPDNVATLDYAFRMRSTTEKFLATCYAYLPNESDVVSGNPAFFGADEFFLGTPYQYHVGSAIARGRQNVNNPLMDYWNGTNGGKALWQGISQCNIFLDNIMLVPDIPEYEKRQWAAEVKFLKAYYHFFLLRMYGPIPIVRTNLPISASGDEVRVFRAPVDDVFDYIIELIEEAEFNLLEEVKIEQSELGRITLPIALAVKAKILVYAASPLFNGNEEYASFVGRDGKALFNPEYQREKWQKAAEACEKAIIVTRDQIGHDLYKFENTLQTGNISPETRATLTYRGTITERWNPEIIWANTNDRTVYQSWFQPRALTSSQMTNTATNGSYGVTLKIAGLFYTKNGVPIDEDTDWDYPNRFELQVGSANEKYFIKERYTTAKFNFDREARFYGALGFDGGIWYGNGNYNDEDPYWLESKIGQFLGKQQAGWHSVPGYWAKKLVYYTNAATNATTYSHTLWPWVMIRLGDLYLLYAEALNELDGPSPEAYHYIDQIRLRAGLPTVEDAWKNHSNRASKYTTQDGLREIIHAERNIEMMFEGQRFWDLRRWKKAPLELNKPITGWDVDQESNEGYYRQKVLFDQQFSLKDYFWPIRESDLIVNKNLVQNPGW